MRSDLFEAYRLALSLPSNSDGAVPALQLGGRANDYISIGPENQPIVLLTCAAADDLRRPPIRLRHLVVEYGVRYRVRTPTGSGEGNFIVVSLRDDDLTLSEAFCVAGDILLAALPSTPSASDIDSAIRQLIEMMTALSLPSSRTIAGLWAELWLILISNDRAAALAAWHSNPSDRFDFAFDTHLVEVKATERTDRSHDFSFDQLRGSGLPIKVASLRLRRIQNGKSVVELVNALQSGLPLDLRTKLLRNVFLAVGNAISESGDIRFDESFARANLRTISADQVPVPSIPVAAPISGMRFRINFDDTSLAACLSSNVAAQALSSPT